MKVLLTVGAMMDFLEMDLIVQVWTILQWETTESFHAALTLVFFVDIFIYYSQMLMNAWKTPVMLMPAVLTPMVLLSVSVKMDLWEMDLSA